MPTPISYGDLASPIPELVADLTAGRLLAESACHLDPDIHAAILPKARPPSWRGALGQVSAAQSHLRKQGVQRGDLFLFWGLFRGARRDASNRWKFFGPRQNLGFGWLQVAEVVALGRDGRHILSSYPWLESHPHVSEGWPDSNTLYIASETLRLGGKELDYPGHGWFTKPVALTAPGATFPSLWHVPEWLDMCGGGSGFTYHPPERWIGNGRVHISSRGQEFVARVGDNVRGIDWLINLFDQHG